MANQIITMYTLHDADIVLRKRRRRQIIRVFNFIVDKLDKFACILIIPVTIFAIFRLFIL